MARLDSGAWLAGRFADASYAGGFPNGKRALYAESGVPSYWVLNPAEATMLVLSLEGEDYVQRAFGSGNQDVTVSGPHPFSVRPSVLLT